MRGLFANVKYGNNKSADQPARTLDRSTPLLPAAGVTKFIQYSPFITHLIITCGYSTVMLWLPNFFIMKFFKGIIGK